MIDHRVPRMACISAIFAIALAHCGCQSMKGPSSWMASSSKPRNPNNKEVVTYWGQKKDKGKTPNSDELRTKLANGSKDGSSRSSTYEGHLRQGNQALRANQLAEAKNQAAEAKRLLAEAKKEYEKALVLRPNDPDCHHRLAVVADKEGQFGEADDHYEAAMKQRPNDANLLSDLGYSYSLRHEDRRAEETLNKALGIIPSHKGAMANLGSLYAKQGRYDEALAMFRRGASEAEAQQYVAQLFPQRNGMSNNDMLAQNNPNNRVSPVNNERPDVANMTPDQLREAMLRERAESKARRQQQMIDESKPRGEWYDHSAGQQTAQVNQPPSQSNSPIVLGPGSGQASQQHGSPNQYPVVTPNSGYGDNNPGAMANNSGRTDPNAFGQNSGQFNSPDSLNARPGTTPDIADWQGAGVRDPNIQRVGAQPNGNPNSQVSNPYYQQPQGIQLPNLQPMGAGQNNAGFGDQTANQAAAQLGMNVGGLFPVVPADAGGQGGSFGQSNQSGPGANSRFGAEFASPPSYQDPAFAPNRSGFAPGDQRQGNFQRSAAMDNEPLGPPSPASGWPQINGNGQVTQAGATSPNSNAVPRFGDPVDQGPAGSTWADKPNLSPAAPYNGSWPAGSQGGSAGSSGVPNSLPNWNNGQPVSRSQPKLLGPPPAAGNEIEPWPFRKQ
jgi:Flp pilus assembly protein TadD